MSRKRGEIPPGTLVEAPNGAIANKKLLDRIEKVAWLKPTIEQPAERIWVLGGYALAPISIIETDGGLIAFDTQIDDIEGVESWSGSRDFDSHMLLERFRDPKT